MMFSRKIAVTSYHLRSVGEHLIHSAFIQLYIETDPMNFRVSLILDGKIKYPLRSAFSTGAGLKFLRRRVDKRGKVGRRPDLAGFRPAATSLERQRRF